MGSDSITERCAGGSCKENSQGKEKKKPKTIRLPGMVRFSVERQKDPLENGGGKEYTPTSQLPPPLVTHTQL